MTTLSQLWPTLEQSAHDAGAIAIGASDLDDAHAALFDDWLARRGHADMHYLARHAEVRRDPRARFPWARSIISILVPYESKRPEAPPDALSHHIARYALGDDYHDVLDGILRQMEETLVTLDATVRTWRYVDTGPLSDRAYATQSGLGWIGKNGMLISQEHGSYTFIGTLVTSLENDVMPDRVVDRCGKCTRCLEACPTDAILPDRTLDSARCISYATIEHRGPLDPLPAAHLDGNAFGCDICQEVCPWNRDPAQSHPAFAARESYRATPVSDLLHMQQDGFSRLFRRSAIKRAKLAGMQRNVEALTSRE